MLKRIFVTFLVIIFSLPSFVAQAHTHLTSTIPADQSTIDTALTEVTLKYEGKILDGSTFELVNSKNELIKPEQFSLSEDTLTGFFTNPLPNDSYTVNWNSISADGHPLTGSFNFVVNTTDSSFNEPTDLEINEVKPIEEKVIDTTDKTIESPNMLFIIVIILLIIVLMGTVVFFIAGRKNK